MNLVYLTGTIFQGRNLNKMDLVEVLTFATLIFVLLQTKQVSI